MWGGGLEEEGRVSLDKKHLFWSRKRIKTNLKNVNVLYLKRGPFSHEMDSLSQACSKTKPNQTKPLQVIKIKWFSAFMLGKLHTKKTHQIRIQTG